MTADKLTADDFPGPPRELPPLMSNTERIIAYRRASLPDATAEDMAACFGDVGQRWAIAMRG